MSAVPPASIVRRLVSGARGSRSVGRTLSVAFILSANTFWSSVVVAEKQTSAERAQQLFDEGRALMKAKQYSLACSKLAESQSLDPGGGTLLNLGICRHHEGRTATAHAILTEALEQAKRAGRTDRITTAKRRLDELAPLLSRLVLELPNVAEAEQMRVAIDGEPLEPKTIGRAMPLDPGVHEVRASLSGHVTWSARVSLAPVADQQTVSIPVLEPEPVVAPPTPVATTAAAPPAPPLPIAVLAHAASPTHSAAPSGPPRWVGYALVGVGTAALATGTYFGARALSLRASSNRQFDGTYCKALGCQQDWNDAKTAAAAADIGIGVGLVALGAGIYLLLRPATNERQARAATETLTIHLSGSGVGATGQMVF